MGWDTAISAIAGAGQLGPASHAGAIAILPYGATITSQRATRNVGDVPVMRVGATIPRGMKGEGIPNRLSSNCYVAHAPPGGAADKRRDTMRRFLLGTGWIIYARNGFMKKALTILIVVGLFAAAGFSFPDHAAALSCDDLIGYCFRIDDGLTKVSGKEHFSQCWSWKHFMCWPCHGYLGNRQWCNHHYPACKGKCKVCDYHDSGICCYSLGGECEGP